jgi:hypothetical protein
MSRKHKQTTAPETTITSDVQIQRFANLPVDKFVLGDREFDIKDLPYDSYIAFVSHLAPLIEVLVKKMSGTQVSIPGINLESSAFSTDKIILLCKDTLPEMVQLMCKETDPDITVADVKALAKRPTVLANAVIRQVKQNEMIQDFTDFFAQVVSAVKTT